MTRVTIQGHQKPDQNVILQLHFSRLIEALLVCLLVFGSALLYL
jgi:hypothetical protein